jgi:hypothetical protein
MQNKNGINLLAGEKITANRITIIDIDAMRANDPKPMDADETVRGFTVRDVYRQFEQVKSKLGNPPLKYPIIINDPKSPVNFGITLEWQVMLNMAAIPSWLEGIAAIEWLRLFPIYHEVAHYAVCPFDGITHARMMIKVIDAWKSALSDECLFIINFFSDIIVNDDLHGMLGTDFFNAMKEWVEYTIIETTKNNYNISTTYLIFILVHEMMWNQQFSTFIYPDAVRATASKIVDIMKFSSNWYDAIFRITEILKPAIINETRNDHPGHGMEVISESMKSKMSKNKDSVDPCNGSESPSSGSGSASNEKASKSPSSQGSSTPSKKDASQNKSGEINEKILVKIKKDNKITSKPFDMTFFMGDPVAEKTRGNINKDEKNNEREKLLSIIDQMDVGFGAAGKLMKFMHVSDDDDQAWRLWLRAKSRGIMKYDTMTRQKERGGISLPSEWEWGRPTNDWNIFSSVMISPRFPFPPFATGFKEFRGPRGCESLPDVRDLLIVRDSSGSMAMTMDGMISTVNKIKFGTIERKLNNKFNLSALATFAALQAAHYKGAKYAVINFSSDRIETDWMRPEEKSIDMAERVIMHYQGGGTVIPIGAIMKKIGDKKHTFILVITDSNLFNWKEFFKNLDFFASGDHEISMIFTSSKFEKINMQLVKKLGANGISVFQIKNKEELFSVTLKEMNRAYR